MNIFSSMLLCALFSWTLPSAEMTADGWIALFDGQTTFGWKSENMQAWTIEENSLLAAGPASISTTASFKSGKVNYQIRRAPCEPWEDKTAEIVDGAFSLDVPEGQVLAVRNVFFKPDGMKDIFNGKDLTGWNTYPEMDGKFSVNSELKRLEVKNGLGMLETAQTYGDFIMQCDVSLQPKVNSGIFFRCIPGEKLNGYECQLNNTVIDDDPAKPAEAGSGAIFRRTVARSVMVEDPQVFHVTIIARGGHIATWVNGLQQTDWVDTRKANPNPRRGLRVEPGTIMIQAHDVTTDCWFKNMKINSWD